MKNHKLRTLLHGFMLLLIDVLKLFPILMSIHVIMFALIGKKDLSYTFIQLYKKNFDDREYAMKLDICVCYMWLVANVQSKKGYLDGGE